MTVTANVMEKQSFMNETSIDIVTVDGSGTETILLIGEQLGRVVDVPVTTKVVRTLQEAETVSFNRLMLLGGGDIAPELYGEERTGLSQAASPNRDSIEWQLGLRAKDNNIPMMGICRGHQMIAALFGGTLYQDFEVQTNNSHGFEHSLSNVQNPLAARLPQWKVNSLHHQAVKTVPQDFIVTATASDGIIESIWKPRVLGVQFHPEMLVMNDARWLNLFLWFLLDKAENTNQRG